jgi:hypothetical protein
MFVRWMRRRRYRRGRRTEGVAFDHFGRGRRQVCYNSEPTGEWRRHAMVLESVRTPAGPRQRYVCYLGAILEGAERDRPAARDFWRSAEWNLRRARIDGTDLAGLVASLRSAVPRPDEDSEPPWDGRWRWRSCRILGVRDGLAVVAYGDAPADDGDDDRSPPP